MLYPVSTKLGTLWTPLDTIIAQTTDGTSLRLNFLKPWSKELGNDMLLLTLPINLENNERENE